MLIDSGLDDRGALDFTVPGLVAATPAEVAAQLKASGRLNLRGFTVIGVGIGYTAAPQPPLSDKWRSNVTQIWVAVLRAAGASVEIIPQPGQGPSVSTDEPVRPVPVPVPVPVIAPVRPATHTTIVFTGASPVRFEPNTTAFVDPAARSGRLLPSPGGRPPIAHATPGSRAPPRTSGRCPARGPWPGCEPTGFRGVLISLDAAAAQITTTGVGSHFPQFTPDRNAAGTLLAGPATPNRSVRITLG